MFLSTSSFALATSMEPSTSFSPPSLRCSFRRHSRRADVCTCVAGWLSERLCVYVCIMPELFECRGRERAGLLAELSEISSFTPPNRNKTEMNKRKIALARLLAVSLDLQISACAAAFGEKRKSNRKRRGARFSARTHGAATRALRTFMFTCFI